MPHQSMPQKPWKPPLWLIALDGVGAVLLGLGLAMHYNTVGFLEGFPPSTKFVLLVLGGAMLALGMFTAVRLVLAHQRS